MIHMVDLVDYENTVHSNTWDVLKTMVKEFKDRNLRVSFFNSTPQGGGGKLMRFFAVKVAHDHFSYSRSDAPCFTSPLPLDTRGRPL